MLKPLGVRHKCRVTVALEWRRQRRDERGATTKVIKGMIEERGEAWTDGREGGRRKEEDRPTFKTVGCVRE